MFPPFRFRRATAESPQRELDSSSSGPAGCLVAGITTRVPSGSTRPASTPPRGCRDQGGASTPRTRLGRVRRLCGTRRTPSSSSMVGVETRPDLCAGRGPSPYPQVRRRCSLHGAWVGRTGHRMSTSSNWPRPPRSAEHSSRPQAGPSPSNSSPVSQRQRGCVSRRGSFTHTLSVSARVPRVPTAGTRCTAKLLHVMCRSGRHVRDRR